MFDIVRANLTSNSPRFKASFQTHLEHFCKARDDSIFDRAHINFAVEKFSHRSYRFAFAGDYQIEETKVRVDVQSKAVRRHPSRNVNAYGCDLACARVNARQTLYAKALDSEIGKRANQYFFQLAHVAMNILALRTQAYNRITNNLPNPVIGDFASAIRLKYRDASLVQHLLRSKDSGLRCAAPERERVGVF